MGSCVCAPGIEADIVDARARGVRILGCCGDVKHSYGFHVPAVSLPRSDYSIRRSSGIANPDWACAGDFATELSWSRDWLAWLVGECRAGRMPMVVEIIGSLDGAKPSYWAAWNNWAQQLYTGQGHVGWAHVSWDRAQAAKKAGLFANYRRSESGAPAYQGRVLKLATPYMRGQDVSQWQSAMRTKGHTITVDGVFGPQSDSVARAFQRVRGLDVDGKVGPATWAASFK